MSWKRADVSSGSGAGTSSWTSGATTLMGSPWRPPLGFGVGDNRRVFPRHEPVVDALGEPFVGDRVVHEPPGDIDLAHGAAGPGDHFGREPGAPSQLLADGEQQGVHARRIRRREL